MTALATVVRRDRGYKEATNGKTLTNRERALEQAIIRVGEQELGKLRSELTTLEGKIKEVRQKAKADKKSIELKRAKEHFQTQLEHEREKTRLALWLGGTGKLLGTVARGVVTPWDQLLSPTETLLLPSPSPASAVGENNEKVIDAEYEVKSDTSKEDQPTGVSTSKRSRFAERLLASLPKPLKAFVIPIATFFTSLSPLSSAILILTVAVGAFGWAEWSKSSLREMKVTLEERNQQLKEELEDYNSLKQKEVELAAKIREADGKARANELEINRLRADNSRLQDDAKSTSAEHKALVEQLLASHKDQLDTLKTNADEGFKKVNAALESQIDELRRKNDELSKKSSADDKELGRLRPIEKQYLESSKTLSGLRKALQDAESKNVSLETQLARSQTNTKFLRSMTKGMKQELDNGLLSTQRYGDHYRKKFRETFNSLMDSHFEYFHKECGLARYAIP